MEQDRIIFNEIIAREKTAAFYVVDILGLPYGGPVQGKDLHGKYFSRRTDFQKAIGDEIPAVFHHGRDQQGHMVFRPEFYEPAQVIRTDEKGVWFRVKIEKAKSQAKRIWEAAVNGTLRGSTGLAGTLARWLPSGEYTLWTPGELSLVVAEDGAKPVNDFAIGLPVEKLKAIYNEFQMQWPEATQEAARPIKYRLVLSKKLEKELKNEK